MNRRITIWLIVLSLIIACGWYKSRENRLDRERITAWRDRNDLLNHEGREEYERLLEWFQTNGGRADARQRLEDELNGGRSLPTRQEGEYLVADWAHPTYGIRLQVTFAGGRIVSRGIRWGTAQLAAVNPPPPRTSREGAAEAIRTFFARWTGWLWLPALLVAVFSRTYGLVAAEVMLAISLVCGTAWTVSPLYPISVDGIFSNDRLFFAGVMYFVSLIVLAVRVAHRDRVAGQPIAKRLMAVNLAILVFTVVATGALMLEMAGSGGFSWGLLLVVALGMGALVAVVVLRRQSNARRPAIRFRVGTLLLLTTAVAVLAALGPFGLFALAALGAGAVLLGLILIPLRSAGTPSTIQPQ